jgi:hypothetical protein
MVNGAALQAGDGLTLEALDVLNRTATEPTEALLFDLAA